MADLRENLENRVKHQVEFAKSGFKATLIIYALIGVVLIGLAGLVWWKMRKSGAIAKLETAADTLNGKAPAAKEAAWDGKTPFSCTGADAPVLHDVVATAGVSAMGGCKLTLKNVEITAAIAVTAAGNAQVTVEGGELNGTDAAITAGGNAQVEVKGAKVTGKANKAGNGKILGM
jgi:hypothetical protein